MARGWAECVRVCARVCAAVSGRVCARQDAVNSCACARTCQVRVCAERSGADRRRDRWCDRRRRLASDARALKTVGSGRIGRSISGCGGSALERVVRARGGGGGVVARSVGRGCVPGAIKLRCTPVVILTK